MDGREEELPDVDGSTGGGLNEDGEEDERMVAADAAGAARELKSKSRYEAGVDAETLKVINHFIGLFQQSVSGIGLMSENNLNSGAGSKRDYCEISYYLLHCSDYSQT